MEGMDTPGRPREGKHIHHRQEAKSGAEQTGGPRVRQSGRNLLNASSVKREASLHSNTRVRELVAAAVGEGNGVIRCSRAGGG